MANRTGTDSYARFERIREGILCLEENSVIVDPAPELRVAAVSLLGYEVALSGLGFQNVYRLFNGCQSVGCERIVCLDETDADNVDCWRSLESFSAPDSFAVLALSIPYEQNLFMLPRFLKAAGIPVRASDRWGNMPLVMIGGPVVGVNPEPVAPFADICALGDAETLIGSFVAMIRGKDGINAAGRERFLESLACNQAGFYVPALYSTAENESGEVVPVGPEKGAPSRVVRQVCPPAEIESRSVVVSRGTHFRSMYLVELARGCRCACRFCLVSTVNRPFRTAEPDKVIAALDTVPQSTKSVGLVGANICDYPALIQVLEYLSGRGMRLGVASLRVDAVSERLLALLRRCSVRTVTIAPESASQRLLEKIGKGYEADELLDAVRLIAQAGFEELKLYYMIGLPGETEADRLAIEDQVKRIAAALDGNCTLTVSINPFIPKAQTPFQDEPMLAVKQVRQALKKMKKEIEKIRVGGRSVKVRSNPVGEYLCQAIISIGDRKVGEAIEKSALENINFPDALQQCGVDIESRLNEQRNPGRKRPWALIERGLDNN